MSIKVDLARLAETTADFDHAYLLTVSSAGIVKVNAVDPVVTESSVTIPSTSMQARLNLDANPAVTLVWPPTVRHGHTLIVDGHGVHDASTITVHPETAILPRPGDHADGPAWADKDGCVQDCRNV